MAPKQSSNKSRDAKTRGQKRNTVPEAVSPTPSTDSPADQADTKPKRRKHDRFGGMSEEEVLKRTLPDLLAPDLDIVVIGINPGLVAAHKGHYYPGPGNHFWECLYQSGFTSEKLTSDDDYKLLQLGIGFTNIVKRATKGSPDLTRQELREGGKILLQKLQEFKPKVAVFNGKLIYEVFSGKKEFYFGLQPECVDGTETRMWVMPSSSARCAQLPKASDKVPYYQALKKYADSLKNGTSSTLDKEDVVFPDCKLKSYSRKTQPTNRSKKKSQKDESEDGDDDDE